MRSRVNQLCAESSDTSASKQVVPILIDGLRRLEYRGYDSAGVAVVRNGEIDLRRSAGKLARLEEVHRDHTARRASTASATRAGRPTAGRPRRTRIRTATAPADRRRAQRHHRELPRSEAAAAAGGPHVRHRDRHRDRRAPRRARDEGRRARERGAAGAARTCAACSRWC